MAVAVLNSIGSIATHIVEILPVSTGISGNMIEIVDQSRQHVANYVGESIGSKNIAQEFQGAITDYAKADTMDLINAQAGGEKIRLAELSISETGDVLSAKQYRLMGDSKLRAIGRKIQVSKSLS